MSRPNVPTAPNSYDRSTVQNIVGALTDAIAGCFQKREDVRLLNGERFSLKSANGTEWFLGVDNAGGLGPTSSGVYGAVSTTNATVTTIATIAIPAGAAVMISATIAARRTGGSAGTAGDSVGYVLNGLAKNIGGVVSIVAQSKAFTAEDQAAWDAAYVVSGTNIVLQVTGEVNNTIHWVASGQIRAVT